MMAPRDKVKLINQAAMAKALYGCELSMNHTPTVVANINKGLERLAKNVIGVPQNVRGEDAMREAGIATFEDQIRYR